MKRIALLLLLWSLLWLGGSFWAALGLQADLEREARSLLASTAETRAVTSRLEVKAEGQALRLTGTASRASDQSRALSMLREEVRLEGLQGYGAQVNPVAQVVDGVVLELKPAGWGILAGTPRPDATDRRGRVRIGGPKHRQRLERWRAVVVSFAQPA